jgi:hypothetical protein
MRRNQAMSCEAPSREGRLFVSQFSYTHLN